MSGPYIVALTDDYAMSALTVAIWGKPDQICSMSDFLRMTRRSRRSAANRPNSAPYLGRTFTAGSHQLFLAHLLDHLVGA
jgi:hypothetical protein